MTLPIKRIVSVTSSLIIRPVIDDICCCWIGKIQIFGNIICFLSLYI